MIVNSASKRIGCFDSIELENKSFKFPDFYQELYCIIEFSIENKILILKIGNRDISAKPAERFSTDGRIGKEILELFIDFLEDKMAVVFYDENAIYLSPYRLGEEHLRRFLTMTEKQ